MIIETPVALAAAADLLALYGIIEAPKQPVLSTSILAASAVTVLGLVVGILTGWSMPTLDSIPVVDPGLVMPLM